jgi:hypothetical protein
MLLAVLAGVLMGAGCAREVEKARAPLASACPPGYWLAVRPGRTDGLGRCLPEVRMRLSLPEIHSHTYHVQVPEQRVEVTNRIHLRQEVRPEINVEVQPTYPPYLPYRYPWRRR